jgi:hypothetical protein
VTTSLGRRLQLLGGFVFSQLVLLLLLRMPAVPGEGSWLQSMRGYFAFDQLSYAAIASTTAAGTPGLPEPFTETGFSYYPSLWYRLLGWAAAVTGGSVPAAWTILGYLLLAAAIAWLGWSAYRISGLPWAPALVGPAVCIGILAVVTRDEWYVTLQSHATLWGPFGSLYVLNAEVAAISCLGIAFAIVLNVALGGPRSRISTIVWLSVAAALIGLTANLQTYAFFVGAGIAFAWLGAYGLLRSRSRALLISTVVLIVATFPLGRVVASAVGALPVYGLLILCTLPGAVWVGRRNARLLLTPAIVFLLAAAPQAAIVASGIARKDAFLTYRQDVSSLLGVPVWLGILFALPIISVWLLSLVIQRSRRNDIVLAALAGLAFSGIMLSFNDAWGFGQEPYRMWIDSVTVSALVLAPLTAWSIAAYRAAPPSSRPSLVPIAATAAIALVGLSLLDFGSYRTFVSESGVYRFDTARINAMTSLAADTTGLLANGPCIDAQELKIATRKPVAFYNAGLAWPEDKGAIDAVMDASRNGTFDPDAMRAAKVRYLITDSACGVAWPVDTAMGVVSVGTADYADEISSGTLTLWKIA